MARWAEDEVDRACSAWAYQWVQNFGNRPLVQGQTVGAVRCAIEGVQKLKDGAGSSTFVVNQHWPEVFIGEALKVVMALSAMGDIGRAVIFWHYVERWYDAREIPGTHGEPGRVVYERKRRPTKQHIIAERKGLGLRRYHELRDCAKSCVRTVLHLEMSAHSNVVARTPGQTVQAVQALELSLAARL